MLSANNIKIEWPITGHRSNIGYLTKSVNTNSIVSAYLFAGPKSVGKTSAALNFAQILLCTDNKKRPCGSCENCKKFINRSHPDVILLEKDADKKNIGIDDIREKIIHRLQLSSFYNSYKVAIIDGAEMLSTDAANSLLKTLEEPTKNSLIILIAHRLENIPQTVISRCQRINFLPVSTEDTMQFLKNKQPNINQSKALTIARIAAGRPGLAWQYLHVPEFLEERKNLVTEFVSMANADVPSKFSYLGELTNKKTHQESAEMVSSVITLWQIALRDMLLLNYQLLSHTINYFAQERLLDAKNKYSPSSIIKLIRLLQDIKNNLGKNINPRLVIENFLLQF